ncbi:MAG TPA: hypothetical protein VGI67_01295 [Thermoleophilaceae bacterium]|jgi:hypothetical protein
MTSEERCSWCGAGVEPGDGWRLTEPAGARRAVFCRLEHIVPWAIQGPKWEAGESELPDGAADECAHCGERLGDTRVVLVRHRGGHRIPDAFCSVEHAADWAKAGGRWR